MALLKRNFRFFGSANMQETDAGTPQGGLIDKSVGIGFANLNSGSDSIDIVSDAAGDTTQTVTVNGRRATDEIVSDVATLNGTTPVTLSSYSNWASLWKAVKSATCAGTVAAIFQTAVRANTAQGGTVDYITLDAGASAVDNEYLNMVIISIINSVQVVREIVWYDGTNKRAYVHDVFGTIPDAADTFSVHRGVVFDKISAQTEVLTKVHPHYNAVANETGATKDYYSKGHILNNGATAMSGTKVTEVADPSDLQTFDLEDALDDNDTSTNRLTTPSSYTFNDDDKDVPNSGNLSAGSSIGIWFKMTLPAGSSPVNSFTRYGVEGTTGAGA